MTKQTLNESQQSKLQRLYEAVEQDNMEDSSFTELLFELKDQGIDVEQALYDIYDMEL